MQIADEIGIKNLKAYSDSKLIINQACGEYEVRHEDLVPCHNTTIHMVEVQKLLHHHVPCQQNTHADALASLTAFLALPVGAADKILVYGHDLYCPRFAVEDNQKPTGDLQVKEALEILAGPELRGWRFSYIEYALYSILSDDPKEAAAIRRKAPIFYYNAITRTLYRRSHDEILLRFLSHKEAQEALKEAHDGICRDHQPSSKLGDRLRRLGYY